MSMRARAVMATTGTLLTLPLTNAHVVYDARLGVTNDGSGKCSGWADQSGGSHHAVQGTSSRRPTISTTGGKASLLYDGTDDVMTATLSTTSGVKTLYAVVDPTHDSSARALLGDMTGLQGAGALSGTHRANDGSWRDSGVAYASGLQRLTYQMSSAAGFLFWKNGVAATPATWTTNPSSSSIAIGAANGSATWPFRGHILFWALYGATRNTAVEAYLLQEFGV